MAAHDREAVIYCDGLEAIAVFYDGGVICARCGEPVVAIHASKIEQALSRDAGDVLGVVGAGTANGGPHDPPPAA